MKDDGTFSESQWGQVTEGSRFVEHVKDCHLIIYSCQNIGEDEMDQRVRIAVDESKIPKTPEELQVFREAARKAIVEPQEKMIKEQNL